MTYPSVNEATLPQTLSSFTTQDSGSKQCDNLAHNHIVPPSHPCYNTPMNLFDHNRQTKIEQEAPLAARMRPRTLDEFIGQEHIVGPGRLLRRAIQADQLSSVIFYGPPGTGKTTLARIVANTTQAHFIALNAVLSGVKNIRESISAAEDKRGMFGQKTILFIDEVHRFNKAQQDALLPHVENGTVTLIGATTENPYFEVNKALVSRSRIFQLRQLVETDLRAIVHQALNDSERGYGSRSIVLLDEALDHLVNVANGDARAVLNAIELAVETTTPNEADPDGTGDTITITTQVAEESIQRRAVLYDKDGDAHFDTISAFIKSLRGSDPDAALYWMAKMVYAGEEPRFIFRRMIIFAGEDVGLADPNAIRVVMAAAQAFDYVGMPEGRFHLSQACLYLATAPKSNSGFAFWDALESVQKEREAQVPDHLRDGNRDGEDFGHGKGYLYPHAYRDHWVAQQYLPETLQGRVFYQPSDQGYEVSIKEQVSRRREAQLAAMLEPVPSLLGLVQTMPDGTPTQNRWLQRTLSGVGKQLAAVRDRIFALAKVQRHNLVLDLKLGSGLLTWEAIRRAVVGGVYTLAHDPRTAHAFQQQCQNLEPLERPVLLVGQLDQLDSEAFFQPTTPESEATRTLHEAMVPYSPPSTDNDGEDDSDEISRLGSTLPPPSLPLLGGGATSPPLGGIEGGRNSTNLQFDVIVGRNLLTRLPDKAETLQRIARRLRPTGRLVLAEIVPRHAQRLSQLVDLTGLPSSLAEQIQQVEATIYQNEHDPMVNWAEADLERLLHEAGLTEIQMFPERQTTDYYISPELLTRWFTPVPNSDRRSFADHLLASGVRSDELLEIQRLFERQLLHQTVKWQSSLVYLVGVKK
ncbi:AAA family ATPase [Anaerolineales bacterium HSG25]|nr:AAA family ATPase [Anaerolineales bacterium HSG25]